MLSFNNRLNDKVKIAVFITILILLRICIFALFPNSGVDGPVYLSHAFSVLDGHFFQNDFLLEYIPVFNFPYLYGFLNAPLFFIFRGTFLQTYSLLFWSTVWLLLFIYGAYKLMYKQGEGVKKIGFFSAAYIINIYSSSTRSELFILPFFILLLYSCSKAFADNRVAFRVVIIPLLITGIGLMHPVAGVFACSIVLVYALEKRISLLTIITLFVSVGLLLALLYLPVVFINYTAWQRDFFQTGFVNRTHSLTDFSPLFKYLLYNPSVLVLALFIFLNTENVFREIVIWLLPFCALCYFHQSYYYHYLFVLILWRLLSIRHFRICKLSGMFFYASIIYGFIFGTLWPITQYLENPAYTQTYKNTLSYLYQHEHNDTAKKIWVPGDIAMPIIDNPNTRLHWVFMLDYKNKMDQINDSSIIYFTLPSQWEYLKKCPYATGAKLKVVTIIKPVRGLLTISSHFKRSEPLGLWEVTISK